MKRLESDLGPDLNLASVILPLAVIVVGVLPSEGYTTLYLLAEGVR